MIHPTLKFDLLAQRAKTIMNEAIDEYDENDEDTSALPESMHELQRWFNAVPEERGPLFFHIPTDDKYDVRNLPLGFLYTTGKELLLEAASDESRHWLWQSGSHSAYFEFDDCALLVSRCFDSPEEELPINDYQFFFIDFSQITKSLHCLGMYAETAPYFDGDIVFDPLGQYEGLDHFAHNKFDYTIYCVLGVLCLIEERLAGLHKVSLPDMSSINKRRISKGKAPLIRSDYSIVKLNISEVRRRAGETKRLKHESPVLHWRRGHWRTIHRYSTDERKVWVRKCLVGDPDKGMLEKHYRVVNEQRFR